MIQKVAGNKDKAEPVLDAASSSTLKPFETLGNSSNIPLHLQEGETYAALYIRLLNKLSRNDTLQFILVLLGDFIAGQSISPFLQFLLLLLGPFPRSLSKPSSSY